MVKFNLMTLVKYTTLLYASSASAAFLRSFYLPV